MAPHSDVEGNHLEYVLTGEDYVAFNVYAATTLAETQRQLFGIGSAARSDWPCSLSFLT